MTKQHLKPSNEFQILVVDDEESICAFVAETLRPSYPHVKTTNSATEAIGMLREGNFDIVISDLKLPDLSGIEVLRTAKEKDEYTETIMVTGYASMESAAEAINLGVTSYMRKPLQISEFLVQVERAVSSRLFHLKSLDLMNQADQVSPEVKSHLQDITALYYFSRKLMLSLEVPEVMRIILEEANERMGSGLCVAGIHYLDFVEAFAMPCKGRVDERDVRTRMSKAWDYTFDILSREKFEKGDVPLSIYGGRQEQGEADIDGKVVAQPMTVLGRTIGFLAAFYGRDHEPDLEKQRFMYVFTSMISSMIEHAYLDMQAKLQAKTDGLTGVANHRMFHETLEREIARADRNDGVFCLALIDIDDFKKVNDTYGHLVGDAVLVDLTKRISFQNRRGDTLARYGGEEFALILPETDLEGGKILADRICKTISEHPFSFSQTSVSYTVSIGVAAYDGKQPVQRDVLIARSDEGLYASKRNGKNQVTLN